MSPESQPQDSNDDNGPSRLPWNPSVVLMLPLGLAKFPFHLWIEDFAGNLIPGFRGNEPAVI